MQRRWAAPIKGIPPFEAVQLPGQGLLCPPLLFQDLVLHGSGFHAAGIPEEPSWLPAQPPSTGERGDSR